MGTEKVAVYISKRLYEHIKSRLKKCGQEFDSVDSYVEFVLTEVVKEDAGRGGIKRVYTKDEEEYVKNRLRNLGYL